MNKDLRNILLKKVGAELNKNDFYLVDSSNNYFIYHRKNNTCIEIVQISKDKYETFITVSASVAYLNVTNDVSNINFPMFKEFSGSNYEKINTDDCYKRYILKGNFGNNFHYGDIYFVFGRGIAGIDTNQRNQ